MLKKMFLVIVILLFSVSLSYAITIPTTTENCWESFGSEFLNNYLDPWMFSIHNEINNFPNTFPSFGENVYTGNSIDYSFAFNHVFSYEGTHCNTSPVPEPSTMLLLGSGLVGLVMFGKKKWKNTNTTDKKGLIVI